MSFRDQLSNLLVIIADLAKNNIENSVYTSFIIEHTDLSDEEVFKYLHELESRGLIILGSKLPRSNLRLINITKEGLDLIPN